MEITDKEKAQYYLSHIGYYRLSAYMYPLLSIPKEQHLFDKDLLLRLLIYFFSDSPIQQAFTFLVQLNTETYHLSLVCLERFQVAVS